MSKGNGQAGASAEAAAHRRFHPGRGRARGLAHNKGRQVEPMALDEVRALLGERPRRPDLLVEFLHLIQDRFGHLSAAHLAALAAEMRMAMAEVYEVATFYHNFDVVTEDEAPPPALTVRVCDSLTCALMGAERVEAALKAGLGEAVRVIHGACMGRCEQAPVVRIGKRYASAPSPEQVRELLAAGGTDPLPEFVGFEAYRAAGGYRLLGACHEGERSADALIESLEAAGLRGLGGAGFPAGMKWRFVRREPGPRLMAVNADESEPGTFKDRYFLLTDPHRFLEGTLLGAFAVEAAEVYIYLRDEYPDVHQLLEQELEALPALGLELPTIHLRRGAGAYICGEESAMLESLEGKRGLPRHKPPFPSQVGLFGRPTLINNVETLYWVRDVIERGADWFAAQGTAGHKGPRSYSVSGRVAEPGVKLAHSGISLQALIDAHCGGMAEGHELKAFLPGGASGGIFPASMADLPLDFGSFEPHGGLIGSAAIIVLSQQDNAAMAALNLMRFFEDESCGQCTPCRVGTEKAVRLMSAGAWDPKVMADLTAVMADASICGLGQAAVNPLRCAMKYFPEDLP
jgi:formate dehydrogenase beta subunit